MKVIQPPQPPTYQVMCEVCKDWLPADRPGVQHDGEACAERCAAVFECPREAEQAAVEAGWLFKERALCPACHGHTVPAARFEAGRAYRLKAPTYEGQRATVLAVNEEWAVGWWWDGDPWHRRHEARDEWVEVPQ